MNIKKIKLNQYRSSLSLIVIVLTFISTSIFARGSKTKRNKQPSITITTPENGWTPKKIIFIKGKVQNIKNLNEITLITNGTKRYLPLISGKFKQEIVLSSGVNYIKVEADTNKGRLTDSIKLVTNNQQLDLKVILSWDTNNTDVDLHVTDPNDEKVFYENLKSAIGGSLDIDVTTGYGPETFTLSRGIPGEYTVEVMYYGGKNPTMSKVLVILFEGTEREKRYTFPALLLKANEMTTIGKFRIK